MDLISNLSLGFGVAFTPINLLYAFIGCLLGTLIGVLPGIGPVATIAMLLPATYALPPVSALIMLAGIYYGAQYGGSTTAILVNLPGESSSVVTVIDGYQMARQGRAGPALAAAGLGSFFAGCVGTLILAAFAAPLTEVAFKFGPAEYFSLMILGLIGAVVLASGSLVKAIGMIVLGLLLGLVGTDVNSGVARFSFDIPELTDGIGFIVIAMGVFGYGEIISNLGKSEEHREVFTAKVTGLFPTKEDFKRIIPAVCAARPSARPGHPARRRCAAGRLRGLHRGEEDQAEAGRSALRQGQHPRRGGARGRQQRRRADLLHPAADAGHPAQRGDGADGGRDDHPQHPAGPAGDDQQPAAVLGPDRLDVDRQRDADHPEPAADRHVDQAADRALTAGCSPRSCCSARSASTPRTTTCSTSGWSRSSASSATCSSSSGANRRRCCWDSSWAR
jgi:hypothetical protein